jgi:hypothetical protein
VPAAYPPPRRRKVFAAAHVAAAPGPDGEPGTEVIDWESTIRFREYLWSYGFGVAEAMDTSQRGMGLSWPQARELIIRSAAARAGALACGAGTDQLAGGEDHALSAITGAYADQVGFVQSAGITWRSTASCSSRPSTR